MARRQVLPEFIAVRIPTRDRNGRLLTSARREQWVEKLKDFLLRELDINGLEQDRLEGLWRGEYDPHTDDFNVVCEECLIIRCHCTTEQLESFTSRGEALLTQMGRDLKQDAMAYETREGLIIIYTRTRH